MERPTVPIVGHNVVLRDWRYADLPIWDHWMQPGHRWKELDGPYYPLPSDQERACMLEQKRAEIEQASGIFPPHSLVIATGDTDDFLGIVTWYWESQETLWPGLGIVIYNEARWGQGLGYEALGLWSDFLFRALPEIVRLDFRTWSGNVGMMRLGEKLGYVEEARFRRARVVGETYYDGLGYGILREEWMRRYSKGFLASRIASPDRSEGSPGAEGRDRKTRP